MNINPSILLITPGEFGLKNLVIIGNITKTNVLNHYLPNPPRQNTSFILKHLKWMFLAFTTVQMSQNKKMLIFWQQFTGIYYGMFCKLFFIKPKPSLILTFIYRKREGILGSLQNKFIKFCISAPQIHIACHSRIETHRYTRDFKFKTEGKFKFILLGEGMPVEYVSPTEDRYFFSGGKSNREYFSVIKAFSQINEKLIICANQLDLQNHINSSLIKIYYNKPRNEFYRYIENSFAVILNVANSEISSGQLVLLHALRYGKPIIVTEGPCMQDYILDDYAFSIKQGDIDSLIKNIGRLIQDQKQYNDMSKRARESYHKYFSIDKYLERIAREAVAIGLKSSVMQPIPSMNL